MLKNLTAACCPKRDSNTLSRTDLNKRVFVGDRKMIKIIKKILRLSKEFICL